MLHDKFYTNEQAAQSFSQAVRSVLDISYYDNVIEPSAGAGALLDVFPEAIGYDLYPEREDVKQADWFDVVLPEGSVLVVSNPPFGKRSKLAIEFFKHAASFDGVEAIAHTAPVTFEKWSIHKQLPDDWHLVLSERMPLDSFTADGKPYRVRCVMQVWVRAALNEDSYEGYKKIQPSS